MVAYGWYLLIGFVVGVLFANRDRLLPAWRDAKAFAEQVVGKGRRSEGSKGDNDGVKVVDAEVVDELPGSAVMLPGKKEDEEFKGRF